MVFTILLFISVEIKDENAKKKDNMYSLRINLNLKCILEPFQLYIHIFTLTGSSSISS